jgi:hypothetical protein
MTDRASSKEATENSAEIGLKKENKYGLCDHC